MVVNTTRSAASRALPVRVMVWPVLAEAKPALAGVPLVALALAPVRCWLPALSRSTTRL